MRQEFIEKVHALILAANPSEWPDPQYIPKMAELGMMVFKAEWDFPLISKNSVTVVLTVEARPSEATRVKSYFNDMRLRDFVQEDMVKFSELVLKISGLMGEIEAVLLQGEIGP